MCPRQHNREFVAVTNRVVEGAPLAVGCLDGCEVEGSALGDRHGDPNRRPGRGRDGPRHKATRKLGRPLQTQL